MPLESLGKVKNNDIHSYHRKNCSFNMLPHWLNSGPKFMSSNDEWICIIKHQQLDRLGD